MDKILKGKGLDAILEARGGHAFLWGPPGILTPAAVPSDNVQVLSLTQRLP